MEKKMFRYFCRSLWLVPDDLDRKWWCKCRHGIVDAPWHHKGAMPAGGSGWLWSCVACGRAFMFAKAIRVRQSLAKLARQQTPRIQRILSLDGNVREITLLATADDWLKLVQSIAQQLQEGERYVFFDGHVLPARHGPVKFKGLWRTHDLPDLPHLSEELTEKTLWNPEYWYADRTTA